MNHNGHHTDPQRDQNGGTSSGTRPRQLEGDHPICGAGLYLGLGVEWLLPPPYLGVLIVQLLGLGEFRWSEATWFVYLMLLVIALPVTLFTFGEEYGWRGYLLPRLLPLGEIRASVLLGVIWGVWHLPLILAGLNYPGVNVFLAIIVFTFVTVALSFTYTWFYVASSGSVLVAAVFHASTNQFSDTFWVPPLLSAANPFAPSVVSAVLIMVLVVVVYRVFKRSVQVKDPERFSHPKLDGTWRDWVR